ncbi:MAG: type II toxin-antitoxin system VapC family toxin [Alphaproteobacteria bacterium]|nr:type II toxin-antitoxin system VapC family toxin [Alphaproteobacteria bacterium]
MDHYLDASFLVALLTIEPSSFRALQYLRTYTGGLIVSDFAAAEFASAISRRVRIGQMPQAEGLLVLSALDQWASNAASGIQISSGDIALAATFLRRLDLPLRTPDAIHVAAADRLGATLVTFDRRMAANAAALSIPVVEP